jgi:hypothetical protein
MNTTPRRQGNAKSCFRESSTELRELESKLRQAYINKELYAQLAERRQHDKAREEQVSIL